jgi:hypothetical protein
MLQMSNEVGTYEQNRLQSISEKRHFAEKKLKSGEIKL